jgi:dihydrofolate synthase/folylpolyglutamate synthase
VRFDSVAQWLEWQLRLNPRGIDLGLERCLPVARAMGLLPLPFPVISVAGTNGKGSCVAMLEAILHAAGYRVGAYTSPHLSSFNETIRVAGEAVDDGQLLQAFEAVADARGEVMLTWFEFRTLAAARILRNAELDLALLEVGLGGRLDAVNMFDADLALIASIGVDHTDWLGESRDQIGREKAGICRSGRAVVCAVPEPPGGFLDAVGQTRALLYRAGADYHFEPGDRDWRWLGPAGESLQLPMPGIVGDCQLGNAAAVVMALHLLGQRFPVEPPAIRQGLERCRLAGRQQMVSAAPELWLDVAHNPEAAEALAATLRGRPCPGKTRAVFAMFGDKDIAGVAGALKDCVHHWHLATLKPPRGASAAQAAEALKAAGVPGGVSLHAAPRAALEAAKNHSASEDRIVVFGSFETVRGVSELESS